MKMEVNVKVDSITKIEQTKDDGVTESFRAVMKDKDNEKSFTLSSPEKFEFDVEDVLTVSIFTPQKKITDFDKPEKEEKE